MVGSRFGSRCDRGAQPRTTITMPRDWPPTLLVADRVAPPPSLFLIGMPAHPRRPGTEKSVLFGRTLTMDSATTLMTSRRPGTEKPGGWGGGGRSWTTGGVGGSSGSGGSHVFYRTKSQGAPPFPDTFATALMTSHTQGAGPHYGHNTSNQLCHCTDDLTTLKVLDPTMVIALTINSVTGPMTSQHSRCSTIPRQSKQRLPDLGRRWCWCSMVLGV
jgi:hypothetical protein